MLTSTEPILICNTNQNLFVIQLKNTKSQVSIRKTFQINQNYNNFRRDIFTSLNQQQKYRSDKNPSEITKVKQV